MIDEKYYMERHDKRLQKIIMLDSIKVFLAFVIVALLTIIIVIKL